MMDIAEESANWKLIRLLERYGDTNELVCAAHACDVTSVSELLAAGEQLADVCLRNFLICFLNLKGVPKTNRFHRFVWREW